MGQDGIQNGNGWVIALQAVREVNPCLVVIRSNIDLSLLPKFADQARYCPVL